MTHPSRALRRACSLALAALVATTSSYALPPPQVGVAAREPDSPSRERLVEELIAQGFHVRDMHPDDDDEAGQAWGLSAKLVVGARRIHVRIIRRNGERVERRDATIDMGQTDEERATAAMRAVEFLRASLIEVGWSTAPELPPPMPPPSATRGAAPSPPKPTPARSPSANEAVVLGMGAGILHSTGGFRPNVVFSPSLSLGFLPSAGMRLGVAVPVTAPAVQAAEGDAAPRPSFFRSSADAGVLDPVRMSGLTGEIGHAV